MLNISAAYPSSKQLCQKVMALSTKVCRSSFLLSLSKKRIENGVRIQTLRHLSSSKSNSNETKKHLNGEIKLPSSSLKFDDHRVFSHKTSWELLRGLLVLRICGLNIVADNALTIFRFGRKFLGERILGWILRPTVYAQFVAAANKKIGRPEIRESRNTGGENPITYEAEEGLKIAGESLKSLGLRLMVAPTLEGDVGEGGREEMYEKNLHELLHLADLTWDFGGGLDQRHPCLQVKATALMSADTLVNLLDAFSPKKKNTLFEQTKNLAELTFGKGRFSFNQRKYLSLLPETRIN